MTREVYNCLQPRTKTLLRFGGNYIYMICLSAIAMRICAGGIIEYYTALTHCTEMLTAIRPCVAVLALGTLLSECASREIQ